LPEGNRKENLTMGAQARTRLNQASTGVLGLSGSAPQTGAGGRITMALIEPHSLSAKVYAKATVNTLTITPKWQTSSDGTNWYDVYTPNNAALVAMVTGTGSAVSATRQIEAPFGIYGATYARLVVVTGVGSGAGAGSDEYSIAYSYRKAPPVIRKDPDNATKTDVTGITGTAPQTVAGGTLTTANILPGSLSALCYAKIGTSNVALTGKWQVSADGTTWLDCYQGNSAALVALGTSSLDVTRRIVAPSAVWGQTWARFVVVSSGAGTGAGAGTDEASVSYSYCPTN
jgi:hypothetical protein